MSKYTVKNVLRKEILLELRNHQKTIHLKEKTAVSGIFRNGFDNNFESRRRIRNYSQHWKLL